MGQPRGVIDNAGVINWLAQQALVIESLGRGDFYERLANWVFTFLDKPKDSRFALAHMPISQIPLLVFDMSPTVKVRKSFEDFLEGAYLLDPVYRHTMVCIEKGESGFFPLKEIAPDEFHQSEFYKRYYWGEGGVGDNVDFVVPVSGEAALSLSIGKLAGSGPYSEAVLFKLRGISPVVNALLLKQWEKANAKSEDSRELHQHFQQAFERFGISLLTERERELVELMLRGYSQITAAEIMGVKPGTVKMHRKNIYFKLDISSHAELFALFLDALKSFDGKVDDPLKSIC